MFKLSLRSVKCAWILKSKFLSKICVSVMLVSLLSPEHIGPAAAAGIPRINLFFTLLLMNMGGGGEGGGRAGVRLAGCRVTAEGWRLAV